MKLEYPRAIGPAGEAGDAVEILGFANLLQKNCRALVEWDADITFMQWPDGFGDLEGEFKGIAGFSMEHLEQLPEKLAEILSQENLEGEYPINIHLPVHPDFMAFFEKITMRTTELVDAGKLQRR